MWLESGSSSEATESTASVPETVQPDRREDVADWSKSPVLQETKGTVLKNLNKEPIWFNTAGLNVTVRKYHLSVLDRDTEAFIATATECDEGSHNDHYRDSIAQLNKAGETVYSVTSNDIPGATYYLMVIPNVLHYADTDAFLKDLPGCGVGGAFPFRSNDAWLVFRENNCAAGAAMSEDDARKGDFCINVYGGYVEPSLQIH